MAVNLREQMRLWSPEAEGDVQFGDGAPMHSSIIYDANLMLNNMQGKCHPFYHFAHDASYYNSETSGVARLQYTRPTLAHASAGTALMCQLPVLVPIQAKRLRFSFAFYRYPTADEVPISVIITDLYAYLAAGPVKHLLDPIADNPAPFESSRLFSPQYISGPYAVFHVDQTTIPTSAEDTGTQYTKMRYVEQISTPGFFETAMIKSDNINDRQGTPNAVFIVALGFSGMVVNESIRCAELAVWFDFE